MLAPCLVAQIAAMIARDCYELELLLSEKSRPLRVRIVSILALD